MNFNLSLDDIIKINSNSSQFKKNSKKMISVKNKLFPRNFNKSNKSSFKSKPRKKKLLNVRDARLKILKNRAPYSVKNISDARLKIEQQRHSKLIKQNFPEHDSSITKVSSDGIIQRKISAVRDNNNVEVQYEDEDMNIENDKINWDDKCLTIRRTIQNLNDKSYYGNNSKIDSTSSFYNESEEDMLLKEITRTIPNKKKNPVNTEKKSYKRSSSFDLSDSYEDEGEISHSRVSPLSTPSLLLSRDQGHRILISNLHENVTGEDIKELFEDVGELIYAKMIRSGMAEVAYKSHKDAMKAVEIYHNRQLDGLPMKCTMVSNADLSNSKKRNSGYVPPVNTFQSVEPDTRVIKKALFSN
ncbi:hypothetical protein PGB90_005554 [Kerria lacca]